MPNQDSLVDSLTLRAMTQEDFPFLQALYASTRWEELQPTGWEEQQKKLFLSHQFALQHQHYTAHYPGAHLDLVLLEATPVGRLYLYESGSEFRIMDIAFLPEYRGRGFGTFLLNEVFSQARLKNKPVTIHVEHNNPALTLYERLGFIKLNDVGAYQLMEKRP